MKNQGYSTVDPAILEGRVDTEHGFGGLDFGSPNPAEDDLPLIDNIHALMALLPPVEADFLDMYYFKHCRQTDIAKIFSVSQPTVCYRLRRAVVRIKFLRKYLTIDAEQMQQTLMEFFGDEVNVRILMTMYQSTCQVETSRRLRMSQGKVRHRFLRSLERLRTSTEPEIQPYRQLFLEINANLNILKEVRTIDREERQFLLDL